MSIGCSIDFVSSKTSKARNGTHQIRDNVFFQYAPGCNLLHGQGYFVCVTPIQANSGLKIVCKRTLMQPGVKGSGNIPQNAPKALPRFTRLVITIGMLCG